MNFSSKLLVCILVLFLLSVSFQLDAQATKASGTTNQKFGASTKGIVCGDQLCTQKKDNTIQNTTPELFMPAKSTPTKSIPTIAKNAIASYFELDDPTNPKNVPSDADFLFVQVGESGEFLKTKDGYKLTIINVAPQVIYFADRPYRIIGHMTALDWTTGLWQDNKIDFKNDPPNAIVTVFDGNDSKEIAVELSNPKYNADENTMQYDVKIIGDFTQVLDGKKQDNKEIPEKFGNVSLFIDNSNDCTPQPNVDLRGCNYANASMSGTVMAGSNLSDVDLSGADLSNSNLTEVDLTGANLENTNLSNSYVTSAKLGGAKLTGINLSLDIIRDLDLSNLDLHGANLHGVVGGFGTYSHVNLSGADLSLADFGDANLEGADLSNTDMTGIVFQKTNLSGANLSGAKLAGFYAENLHLEIYPSFTFANMTGANLSNVKLSSVSFEFTNLSHANLSNTDFNGINFNGANLSHANLLNTRLIGAYLTDANLSGADLTGADLTGADLRGANLDDAILKCINNDVCK